MSPERKPKKASNKGSVEGKPGKTPAAPASKPKRAQPAASANPDPKPKRAPAKRVRPRAAEDAPFHDSTQAIDKPAKTKSAGTPLAIPAILLEGDATPAVRRSGPGARYALAATTPSSGVIEELGDLPEAYGTQRLSLAARDPHWLYASWDMTNEQLREHNAASSDGHLTLRVYANEIGGQPATEVQVHPESRNWFVFVGRAETRFVAELGYYSKSGRKWTALAKSNRTLTPPDTLSEDTSVQFATIPSEISFRQLLTAVQEAAQEHRPLVQAIRELREAGHRHLPEQPAKPSGDWTEAQSKALAAVLTMDQVRRIWIGSLEVTELIRRRLAKDVSSMAAAQMAERVELGALSSETLSSITSPSGRRDRRKGFWFNVNAELIIYGATEPDATVTVGGRQIQLRPDGSFSFRFALPDGRYALPAIATSADGDDSRAAELEFSRTTAFRGQVEKHPQDPALKPPKAESIG